jgi:hypothetical protein
MSKFTHKSSKLAALLSAMIGFFAAESRLSAQIFYYLNGEPASPEVSQVMASNQLAPGSYWLLPNGNFGVDGSPYPMGNIYRSLSLSERRRLYRPGEILGGD